jgi:hypothetical protein
MFPEKDSKSQKAILYEIFDLGKLIGSDFNNDVSLHSPEAGKILVNMANSNILLSLLEYDLETTGYFLTEPLQYMHLGWNEFKHYELRLYSPLRTAYRIYGKKKYNFEPNKVVNLH